ncbi:hypothetical protein ANCDUO_05646 [Ancylostoma duodenale]|uniref:Uncharacterized protein n=1 Tax=Ancylostoma duodenale TaxID=51022 RepID=A0A0C2DN20_9BILA|nr:hypothetical protein ANCDUO_05646 [Ancylostoma duodenale]
MGQLQVPFRKKKKEKGGVDDDKDQLMVLYCLVGKQWMSGDSSAFRCWERVKKQDVLIKRKVIDIVEKKENA